MKNKILRILMLVMCLEVLSMTGCGRNEKTAGETSEEILHLNTEENSSGETDNFYDGTEQEDKDMIYAEVGEKVLEILPADNSSAQAFIQLLREGDVTVEMRDYGSFEKVGNLGTSLPTNDENITTEAGDIILYQGNQITIYYDTNTWSFTRLGKVQGLSQAELKEVLGKGDVSVRFFLEDAR